MKRIILSAFALASFGLFAQNGQTPNSGFENWTTQTASATIEDWFTNNPQDPNLVSRSTDASDQMYAPRLETIDIDGTATAAQLAYGVVLQSGFYMHEYTSPVDSFVFYVKYDFALNDSGTVLVNQSVGGNIVPTFVTVGGTSNGYERIAMEMTSPQQDSIQILITTENLAAADAPVAGSVMTIDDVFFVSANATPAALPNPSFENWTIEEYEEADDWNSLNGPLVQNGDVANTLQSTDAQEGMYSAQLVAGEFDFNGFPFPIPGVVSNATFTGGGFGNGAAYTARPDSMTGWYKASVATDDTCTIQVTFFETGTVIEDTTLLITSDVSTWTKFTFNFDLPIAPDTMLIICQSGTTQGTEMYVDNFAFAGGDLGTEELNDVSFTVYPNPSTDFVNVTSGSKMDRINVYAMNGQLVKTLTVNGTLKVFNVSNMESGAYLMEVVSGNSKSTQTLMVK